MKPAAVYLRISSDRDGDQLGVKRQQADCLALCESRSWTVGEVFTDNDVSAYRAGRRPGYERMLSMIESGTFGSVVAWHPDRLHRSPVELERFIDIIEAAKVKVATVQGGEYDLATASGRMTARVVGAVARHESEHKSERLSRKHLELAKAGKVAGGGWRPFGYADDRVTIVEDEAAVIRRATAGIIAGRSVRGICAELNDAGRQTTTGKPWRPTVLRRLLMSPRIAGLRQHQGVVIGNAQWPGIITRADHERVVAILTDPSRLTRQRSSAYLLTGGLAHCGLEDCGASLVARPKSDGRRCYVCATGPGHGGCGKIRQLADPLEELVADAVMIRLDSPRLARKLERLDSPPAGDAADVQALERRLDELADMWAAGELDRRSWMTARAAVEGRLTSARRALAAQTSTAALLPYLGRPGALKAAWPDLPFDAKRAVLASVIDRVVIGPAVRGRNRFDPERVDIEWRV